jgi:phage terminase small subunit
MNARPLELYESQGNPNRLTKAQIEHRRESEIRIGTSVLKIPAEVYGNPVARKKWKELSKLYDGFSFVSSSDADLIGQYCLAWADYCDLREKRNTLDPADIENALVIQASINKINDQLIKMGDRLFLNPLAKIKNIPKREGKREDPLEAAGFGDI